MSILIKGMAMPINCEKCVYSAWSNFYQIYTCNAIRKNEPVIFDEKQVMSTAIVRSRRADNCPLVPVPPHGRLIDADALRDSNYDVFEIDGVGGTILANYDIFEIAGADGTIFAMDVSIIDDAPTIIEAEEEDNDERAD